MGQGHINMMLLAQALTCFEVIGPRFESRTSKHKRQNIQVLVDGGMIVFVKHHAPEMSHLGSQWKGEGHKTTYKKRIFLQTSWSLSNSYFRKATKIINITAF